MKEKNPTNSYLKNSMISKTKLLSRFYAFGLMKFKNLYSYFFLTEIRTIFVKAQDACFTVEIIIRTEQILFLYDVKQNGLNSSTQLKLVNDIINYVIG
jgi:hypothetical protein